MGRYFVRIRTDTWERLRDLQRVYDLDVFGQKAKKLSDRLFEIEGLLSSEQILFSKNTGRTFCVLPLRRRNPDLFRYSTFFQQFYE